MGIGIPRAQATTTCPFCNREVGRRFVVPSGSVHQHAIREQLDQRLAVVVERAIEISERVQLRLGRWLPGEQQLWETLNEEAQWLEDRIAALEGTHERA